MVGVEQHAQPLAVVVGAEVVEPDHLARRGVQILDGADVVPADHVLCSPHQWWYSPALTSRHAPVIARASDEAKNTTASAISSGSGSLRRSMVLAVSA
ncbi:Uncharacterised protein [Mycobacteroides abscessus subsp. abscessus]|nr:Uncharacterised protein [Mycobacteroides abscessus subsp. abscessus]